MPAEEGCVSGWAEAECARPTCRNGFPERPGDHLWPCGGWGDPFPLISTPPLPPPSSSPLPPLSSEVINNPGCSGLRQLSCSLHDFSPPPIGFVHSSSGSAGAGGCPACMIKPAVQAGPLQMSKTLFSTAPSPIALFHQGYLSG